MEETNRRVLKAVGLTENTIRRMNKCMTKRYENCLELDGGHFEYAFNCRSDCYKCESTKN